MLIRRATPSDGEILVDRGLRSVRATHAFVSELDVESMLSQVRSYLSDENSEIWVACDVSGTAMGFMGLSGSRMDALFLAPEFHRRGAGRLLVRHARSLRGER